MPILNYLDFDLILSGDGSAFRAHVINSPAGQARTPFKEPFSSQALDAFFAQVGRAGGGPGANQPQSDEDAVKTFGAQLFDAVFQGEVREVFRRSVDAADREQAGLRLKLRLDDAPTLADLPWEFLFDAGRKRFLALSNETPIVRFLELPERVQPLRIQPPLNILVMLAGPADYPALDLESEWQRMGAALKDLEQRGLVTLERIAETTTDALLSRLRNSKPYHLFHFIGHGEFAAGTGEGRIIFTDQQGNGRSVDGEILGALLHDVSSLRMVVLNACEGARASSKKPFAGVAQSLVQQGIPAVLAMQFPVTDDAAILFAREFYSSFALGYPVDAALAEARKMIYARDNQIEWGTPVLYLRAPDGRIFDLPDTPPKPDSPAPPATPPAPTPAPAPSVAPPNNVAPASLFISYKHDAEPDQKLAHTLAEHLTQLGHSVFIDTTLRPGESWLEEIDRRLKASDFLIVLLSQASADSEMVKAEIGRAYDYRKLQGHPQTLPVRVAYADLLPYSISAFLNPLQYVVWRDESDNERVALAIQQAIDGKLSDQLPVQAAPAAGPVVISEDGRVVADIKTLHAPLPEFDPRFADDMDAPGGAVKLRDRFYVEREADAFLKREICKTGTTTTIRASRQTGKSSLLVRGVQYAKEKGARVINLDLQNISAEQLASLETFGRYLAESIIRKLRLDPMQLNKLWSGTLGPLDKLTYLMEDYVLPDGDAPLILSLDEADHLLDTKYYQDFFAMIRAWHNNRAFEDLWNRLNVAMVISTEPYLLIPDVTQSPFNVGLKVYLEDFTPAQLSELNQRHGAPLKDNELDAFHKLLSGHPYLTRKALYTMVMEKMSYADLARVAASDTGPFSDHLRRQQWLLRDEPELRAALKSVINAGRCTEDMAFFRLLRAGLVKGSGTTCVCRCGLYRDYFANKL